MSTHSSLSLFLVLPWRYLAIQYHYYYYLGMLFVNRVYLPVIHQLQYIGHQTVNINLKKQNEDLKYRWCIVLKTDTNNETNVWPKKHLLLVIMLIFNEAKLLSGATHFKKKFSSSVLWQTVFVALRPKCLWCLQVVIVLLSLTVETNCMSAPVVQSNQFCRLIILSLFCASFSPLYSYCKTVASGRDLYCLMVSHPVRGFYEWFLCILRFKC